jgi:hypothetical protein
MFPDASSPPPALPPTQFGKVKPASAQDIVWGRPVFRAPELPALAFAPLPLREQFFAVSRPATGH